MLSLRLFLGFKGDQKRRNEDIFIKIATLKVCGGVSQQLKRHFYVIFVNKCGCVSTMAAHQDEITLQNNYLFLQTLRWALSSGLQPSAAPLLSAFSLQPQNQMYSQRDLMAESPCRLCLSLFRLVAVTLEAVRSATDVMWPLVSWHNQKVSSVQSRITGTTFALLIRYLKQYLLIENVLFSNPEHSDGILWVLGGSCAWENVNTLKLIGLTWLSGTTMNDVECVSCWRTDSAPVSERGESVTRKHVINGKIFYEGRKLKTVKTDF